MLRTIFVLGLITIGSFYALQSAFYGLLFYTWVAYFRPESWVWSFDFFQSLNLSLWVGLYLVLRTIGAPGDFKIDLRRGLIWVFLAHVILSVTLSSYVTMTSTFFQDFIKVLFITYLMSALANEPYKIRLVLLVMAMSLGFENAKQGWVNLIISPGAKNANPVVNLGDENEVAVGLLMLTPVLFALARTSTGKWAKWEKRMHQFVGVGVAYRAISTYSRGGFLAAAAMTMAYVARSKHKVRTSIAAAVVCVGIAVVLPPEFWERMSTIRPTEGAEMETSAASRPHFWAVARDMAADHAVLGVGVLGYMEAYNNYDFSRGRFGRNRSVHSSWFGVLADLGYTGFVMYVTILGLALAATQRVIKLAKQPGVAPELGDYASALQTGLVAYLVGGSFVTFQYREIIWHYVALSTAMLHMATRAAAAHAAGAAPLQSEQPFEMVDERIRRPA
jgi:probable O-glycosylation ligase (exosortase A-associated)